jgi:hypothetical protein
MDNKKQLEVEDVKQSLEILRDLVGRLLLLYIKHKEDPDPVMYSDINFKNIKEIQGHIQKIEDSLKNITEGENLTLLP